MTRFAFDIGSGSIGWAVFNLNDKNQPNNLIDMGSCIFSTGRDPKSKNSNAMGRRIARQERRQRYRRKNRKLELEQKLIDNGLMPRREDTDARNKFFEIDPIQARDRCANIKATIYEIGRSIWHISERRGFKSNRKIDRTSKNDTGKIASASTDLRKLLIKHNVPTYGSWLARRHDNKETTRVRLVGEGAKTSYDFYPTRDMYEHEFDYIWNMQSHYHSTLTDDIRDSIRDSVFFQRPLKPVDPGRCTLFPDDIRLPKWHPVAQEFLILQQLNNLRITVKTDHSNSQPLNISDRNLIADRLMAGEKLSWSKVKSLLKIPKDASINLEDSIPKPIHNETLERLVIGTKNKPSPLTGNIWRGLDDRRRLLLLKILAITSNPNVTRNRLMKWIGLNSNDADNVEKISLPDGYIRLGKKAATAIVAEMRQDVIVYSDAIVRASMCGSLSNENILNHTDLRYGDHDFSRLPPYYKLRSLQRMIGFGSGNPSDPPEVRYGIISNPTVHIGLGQFRHLMNMIIDRYGKPSQVVVETTREMAKSAYEIKLSGDKEKENAKTNIRWRKELDEHNIPLSKDWKMRMRLWEELGKTPAERVCPYSGKLINLNDLHSDKVEIDHILPFSETFDDSPNNKTVCFRVENRFKGKHAPGNYWSGEELDAIIARVKKSPQMSRKLWRFLPNALEKWNENKGFEDRQLHATGYLTKVVRAYTEVLFSKGDKSNIWFPSGRMTAMLRRRWELYLPGDNTKNRNDHRHHALDAAVIGIIDRNTIQRLQLYSRRFGQEHIDKTLPKKIPEPYVGYRDQVMDRIANVITSHCPNHSVKGKLHEDTAYGLVRDIPENYLEMDIGNVVVRKPVTSLSRNEIKQIRDITIRNDLINATDGKQKDKTQKAVLREWCERTGHRRVRVLKNENTVKPVKNKKENSYKWLIPGKNAYVDILEDSDGKWVHYVVNMWDAQNLEKDAWKNTYPNAKFIMRVFKNDTLQLFDIDKNENIIDGSNQIKKVNCISKSNLRLVGVNESGVYQKRHENHRDEFRWDFANISKLKARRARRVRIDKLGKVRIIPHGTEPHSQTNNRRKTTRNK